MKRKLMPIARCGVVLLIFFSLLSPVSSLLRDKRYQRKYMDFFRSEHNYDVVLLGTSHMYNTVSCMQLWQDYGISSYNFAYSNSRVPESYWMLRHLLRYTQPKLVILDLFQVTFYDMYRGDSMEQRHVQYDSMPFDSLKIQAVLDEFGDYKHWYNYLWPFAKYHSRWDSLNYSDFHISSSNENGSEIMIGLHGVSEDYVDQVALSEVQPFDTVGLEYARKISDLCAQQGIELLLLVAPYSICTPEEQRNFNYVAAELAAPHVSYLNLVAQENIHYQTDSYNADHLNMAGSWKVTDHLGTLLQNEYHIPDHRNDPAFSQMDDFLNAYTSMRIQQLKAEQNPTNYLLRLYDSCFLYNVNPYAESAQNLSKQQLLLLERAAHNLDKTLPVSNSFQEGIEITVYGKDGASLIDRVHLYSDRIEHQ